MTNRLRERLTSIQRTQVSRHRDSGELDATKLTDVALGTNLDSVFMTTRHGLKLSCAVQILLDQSSSMKNGHHNPKSKWETAKRLCIALCDCLERMRIPVEILSFNASARVVKSFATPYRLTPWDLVTSDGGTLVSIPIIVGGKRLRERRERRKIQICITDGEVNHGDKTIAQAFQAKAPDVEFYGFGIGAKADIFRNGTVSDLTADNLIKEVTDKVRDIITAKTA